MITKLIKSSPIVIIFLLIGLYFNKDRTDPTFNYNKDYKKVSLDTKVFRKCFSHFPKDLFYSEISRVIHHASNTEISYEDLKKSYETVFFKNFRVSFRYDFNPAVIKVYKGDLKNLETIKKYSINEPLENIINAHDLGKQSSKESVLGHSTRNSSSVIEYIDDKIKSLRIVYKEKNVSCELIENQLICNCH